MCIALFERLYGFLALLEFADIYRFQMSRRVRRQYKIGHYLFEHCVLSKLSRDADRLTTPPPPTSRFDQVIHRFITARVRSTYDGRLCFHRCVSVQLSGGGYPISGLGRGDTPSQVWVGGYPISGLGRGDDGGGYPISGLDGGGVPPTRSGWGGTPSQVWMVGGGVTPSRVWILGGYPPPHPWDRAT